MERKNTGKIYNIDENAIIIHTKVFNEDNHELIQDFSTTLTNDKIVDKDVILLEEIPESETQDEASGFIQWPLQVVTTQWLQY
ncbi:hypothetical protein [Peribacillus simplex]|uniref:Uncharacterized protein n=1 Tax=Peribacillus simplex TaxID=1478 RepID=A0A9W4PD33_9BACI|nr:hypothetical protein [Peribacillus simplex]MDR4927717.1 hypothetical protein [Peribacillus simplex]WHX92927.1 hypothetical protein QNH50_08790 [Peribacillus simplex]CAH0184791.1 hypothetical protein SRABI133_01517 [Peribacillus simplex]